MGEINQCLKIVFIVFNSLFTCLGAWMIYHFLRATIDESEMRGTLDLTMIGGWIFAVGIFGISLLGSHAAFTENKCCLTAFAVFMGIGLVIMLIFGVVGIVLKKQYCRETEKECVLFVNIWLNFGFAFVAMMGLIISTNMIKQINRYDNGEQPAIAMTNQEAQRLDMFMNIISNFS